MRNEHLDAIEAVLSDASEAFANSPTSPALDWRQEDKAKLERAWEALEVLREELRAAAHLRDEWNRRLSSFQPGVLINEAL